MFQFKNQNFKIKILKKYVIDAKENYYWLKVSCEVFSVKNWTKISPSHGAKTMFFPRTLPRKMQKTQEKLIKDFNQEITLKLKITTSI
jgi:hypothetical protein